MSQPKPTLAQQQSAIQSQLLELYVKKADLEENLDATVKTIKDLRTVLTGIQVAQNAAPEFRPDEPAPAPVPSPEKKLKPVK